MEKSKRIKDNKLKVIFRFAEGLSEEEIQRRLSSAFNILFEKTIKNWKAKQKIILSAIF